MENVINDKSIQQVYDFLGGVFISRGLLEIVFTHSSYANEHGTESNERLEFLGDSVLGLAVADFLYKRFPEMDEGGYSKIKAAAVSTDAIADIIVKAELGKMLKLVSDSGKQIASKKMHANLFEAIVGAIYLEKGFAVAEKFVLRCLESKLSGLVDTDRIVDYKSALQEAVQRNKGVELEYVMLEKSGPDHDPKYIYEVRIDGVAMGKGVGGSKSEAQAIASKRAYSAYVKN